MENYNSAASKRSRIAYTLECMFEYFVSLMMADPFLANLLTNLGMSDATVGLISSLISLAFLFQLCSLLVVQRIRNTKRFAVTIHILGQLFFMMLYFVPFMPLPENLRPFIVIACILIAYFGNYLATSVIFKWGMSYVDPRQRARFSSVKEMVSLIAGIPYTLIMAHFVDKFIAEGNIRGGFLFTAIVILVMAILDFTCLMLIKNEPVRTDLPPRRSFFETVGKIFGTKSFRHVILLYVLWNISCYASLGFMGIYKIADLGLAVGTVQLINCIATVARFGVSRPFGRYTDKRTFARGIELALWIVAVSYVFNIFTTPSLWWFIIIYTVIYQIGQAGISQNFLNITYHYIDRQYFVEATAIKNSIGGLCGFLTSFLCSRLLAYVQANGNTLFGIPVYGQQVLSAISLLFVIATICYCRFVMEKQPILSED